MKLFISFLVLLSICLSGCMSGPAQAAGQPTLAATLAAPPALGGSLIITLPANEQPKPATTTVIPTPATEPVWVTNPVDRTILRVDPQTNSITAIIAVEGRPERVAAGEGGVWALDQENDQVLRIDPWTNRVAQVISLPAGEAGVIATGAGSVWVGISSPADRAASAPVETQDRETIEALQPGSVVQIDPQRGVVTGQYSVQPPAHLAASGMALWVLSHGAIDTPLQIIDLAREQGLSVPFRNAPEWMLADAMAVDENSLWLFSTAYTKIFHAMPDGRILSTLDLEERQPTGAADLLRYGDDLWAATPWGTVMRIHPRTNKVLAQVDLEAPLTSLHTGGGTVWALSQQRGMLFRLDPITASVTARIETGRQVEPTVVPSPTPRVVIWQPCPDAASSRLKVGDIAYVTKDPPMRNRIRQAPDRDAQLVGYINPAAAMTLIDGPQCANGWVWWKVKNADLEGWTAEGDLETYWLVPMFP